MRLKICTIGGTAVYLHAATLLAAAFMLVMGRGEALAAATASILLHEAAHAAAAAMMGQPPFEMELTPLGAVMRLEDEERLPPAKRLLMLSAGPMASLALCFLSMKGASAGWMSLAAGRRLFLTNAAILTLNVLPALPLDGGRIFSLMLSCFLRADTARRILRVTGAAIAVLLIGASVHAAWRQGSFNPTLAAAGCFILYSTQAATTTQALHELRRLMDRKILLESRLHTPMQTVAVLPEIPLRQAVRLLAPRRLTRFVILEPGAMTQTAVMDECEVIAGYIDHPEQRILDLIRRKSAKSD